MSAVAVMPDQEVLGEALDATRIKITFTNMTLDDLGGPLPEIGDRQRFLVDTECTAFGVEQMKDGEKRRTRRMTVTALAPQGPPVKPSGAPDLFSIPGDE